MTDWANLSLEKKQLGKWRKFYGVMSHLEKQDSIPTSSTKMEPLSDPGAVLRPDEDYSSC